MERISFWKNHDVIYTHDLCELQGRVHQMDVIYTRDLCELQGRVHIMDVIYTRDLCELQGRVHLMEKNDPSILGIAMNYREH
ncbi:MAG: hypothetical protein FD143_3352 [Ignavibacteria bacterium]|nr:MAG: hypothetical protein FD143_3352 [Ignavibacteria bacterium]